MIAVEETASQTVPADVPKRPRLLVVDDEESIRELLREALCEYGYDIDTAADGAEGLALFRLLKHDLVLTDLMMPRITGWDLARHLRKLDSDLPIIILTGFGQGLEDDARCHGILLMHKPVRLDAVTRAISAAIAEASSS